MTLRKKTAFVLIAAFIGILVAGTMAEARGFRWSSGRESVKISDIYKDFKALRGRVVTIVGTVVEQDDRGYDSWFMVNDETGMMKVNLWVYSVSFREMALGHKVTVVGKVSQEDGRYVINATKVNMGKRRYMRNRAND